MFAARRFNRSVIYMTQDCYELVASPCRDEALINTSVVKNVSGGVVVFFYYDDIMTHDDCNYFYWWKDNHPKE